MKTLILVKFEKDKIFNASTCGDNCAKWLLKIAVSEDRTINLHHLMEFGEEPFQIRILTIIRGDSATGKTTLVDMIRDHINNPSGTPVELVVSLLVRL